MGNELTTDEIKETARIVRIYCPGFSEEKFESLMELENQLANSGHLQTVQALLRLEEEKGVPCTEALDACEELFDRSVKLKKEVDDLEQKLAKVKDQTKQAMETYSNLKSTIKKAEEHLADVRNQSQKEEQEMIAFRKRAEAEKRIINQEIEDYHQKAKLTGEEVSVAIHIKTEVDNHGFTLETALDISKEFAGNEDAGGRLAEVFKRYGSITKYFDDLDEWSKKKTTDLKLDIASLEDQKKNVDQEYHYQSKLVSQLRADVAAEDQLRQFYQRYHGVSPLMENLASWNQVFFIRCNNPVFAITGAIDHNSGNANFWTDKPPAMCPNCGHRNLLFDEKVYQALNCPVGTPIRLKLGG